MTQLIKDNELIEDNWLVIDTEFSGELPNQKVIVPLRYWEANKTALQGRDSIGVWLDSDEEPESLAEDLEALPVVAINFPKFADGRGYSYARIIRERFNYKGELRAIGDVLQDQLFFMKRCGFNAFSVRADKPIESALNSLDDFSVLYQAAYDVPSPLYRRRA